MYFKRIYLSGTQQYNTIQYNTDILFPIKEPFRAEQLTKNLIQWLCIDYHKNTTYQFQNLFDTTTLIFMAAYSPTFVRARQ